MPGTVFCGTTIGCVNPVTDSANCGSCGHACAGTESCVLGACRPLNDLRAGAIALMLGGAELSQLGSTTNATPSGAGEPSTATSAGGTGCGTIASNNVWFTFTLTQNELVYADTISGMTNFDTMIYLADSTGTPLTSAASAMSCNDDSGCGGLASRVARSLPTGTYYVVVAGFGSSSGNFELHFQHLPYVAGTTYSYAYAQVTGTGSASPNTIVGTPKHPFGCLATVGEDAYWFVSCGTAASTLSLCAADGGMWERGTSPTLFDPSMDVVAGSTGTDVTCDDDAPACPASYMGSAGDGVSYGSRISQIFPRGLNVVMIDNRTMSTSMHYQLGFNIQ